MPSISTVYNVDLETRSPVSLAPDRLPENLAALTLMELAARINREHNRCQASVAMGLIHARNAGEWLLHARDRLPAHQWHAWLAAHCMVSERTAQTYMQIAAGWRKEPAGSGNGDRTLRQASPASTPSPLQDEALATKPALGQQNRTVKDSQSEEKSERSGGFLEIVERSPGVTRNPRPPQFGQKKERDPEVDETPLVMVAELAIDPVAVSASDRKSTAIEESPTDAPEPFTFWIPGSVTPKARPRVTANGTFFPKRYREWRLRAQGEILMQLQQMDPLPQLPIERAALRIVLRGKHRGDGDNSIGSVCDALVSAGVLPSDSLKHIPFGSWRHIPDGETGVKIQIKPLGG